MSMNLSSAPDTMYDGLFLEAATISDPVATSGQTGRVDTGSNSIITDEDLF